jgi:hypothetical protein
MCSGCRCGGRCGGAGRLIPIGAQVLASGTVAPNGSIAGPARVVVEEEVVPAWEPLLAAGIVGLGAVAIIQLFKRR